jgi:NTP pyrophosphatase (non-canonical NTP hydrolase)
VTPVQESSVVDTSVENAAKTIETDPACTGTKVYRSLAEFPTKYLCQVMAEGMNVLAARQTEAMRAKGFYKDYNDIKAAIEFSAEYAEDTEARKEFKERLTFALDRMWKLTKVALEISEYGELVEAIRKGKPGVPLPSDHLPNHSMEEEETADVFIRMLDRSGFSQIDLGGAFAEKMDFNLGREHQHGGKGV